MDEQPYNTPDTLDSRPPNISEAALTIAGVVVFLLLVGVIYQANIVRRYAEQSLHAQSMVKVQSELAERIPETRNSLMRLYFLSPDEQRTTLWWVQPVGSFQLLISIVNSLSTATLVLSVVGFGGRLLAGLIPSLSVFVLTYIINQIYAHNRFKTLFDQMSSPMEAA